MKRVIGAIVIALILGIGGYLYYKSQTEINPFPDIKDIKLGELKEKKGHYFVYLYKSDCPFCVNIADDIKEFSKRNELYVINTEKETDINDYDWDQHSLSNDIEIGYYKNDEVFFYNEKTEQDIENEFSWVEYNILLADKEYAKMNNKKENYIYAISTHPKIPAINLAEENITVPGVPMLLEIKENRIINYYFDDKEIIEFMGSSTKPVNKYWEIANE